MKMRKNMAYAGCTVLLWATTAPAVKVLVKSLPNMEVLALSSALAFVFLLLKNLCTGAFRRAKAYRLRDYGKMAGLGFLGLFLYSALYYYGLSQLSSQEACILNYLWPLMIVLFSCLLLREKLTVKKLLAMAFSFLGIVILTMGGEAASGTNRPAGMLCCIIAAACYGLFSVLNKKSGYDQNIAMPVIWLVTAAGACALGLPTEHWVPLTGVQWAGMLWLGIVVNAVAYLLWALALQGTENTAFVANMAYLTPFLSVLLSAVFLHEKIKGTAIVALVCIVGGILLQNLPGRKNKNKNEAAREKPASDL